VINKIYAFIAPKIIGGDGINPIGNLGIDRMANAKLLTNVHIKTIGDDILVTGYLKD